MLACTQYILKLRPRGSRSWNSKWRAWEPWVWLDPGVEGIILCVGGCSSTVHWLWCNAGLSNALPLPGGTPLPGAQQSMAFSTCVNGIPCGTRLEERPLKWLQLKTSPSLLLLQKVYFKPPSLQCSDLSTVLQGVVLARLRRWQRQARGGNKHLGQGLVAAVQLPKAKVW